MMRGALCAVCVMMKRGVVEMGHEGLQKILVVLCVVKWLFRVKQKARMNER